MKLATTAAGGGDFEGSRSGGKEKWWGGWNKSAVVEGAVNNNGVLPATAATMILDKELRRPTADCRVAVAKPQPPMCLSHIYCPGWCDCRVGWVAGWQQMGLEAH